MTGRPPRGYLPFIAYVNVVAGDGSRDRREVWAVATPFCHQADDLCYPTQDDDFRFVALWKNPGDWYEDRRRILRLFDTCEEASVAAWKHARRWWGGGEPLEVPAIHVFEPLPDGYAIWIAVDQREVWLAHPDGGRSGEFSGVNVSSGVEAYGPKAAKLAAAAPEASP